LILALGIRQHANASGPLTPSTQPTYTLSGTVTDEQGRPIRNAMVAPIDENLWSGATSDHQGRFLIKNLRFDQVQFFIQSNCRNLNAAFTTDPTSKDLGAIVLDCMPARVKGRIVNSAGLPIAGAQIDLHLAGPDQTVYTLPMEKDDQTDNSGQYDMGVIPARAGFTVTVSLHGKSGKDSQTPTVLIGRQALVEMPDLVTDALPPTAHPGPAPVRYSGRVLDGETQQPVAGVKMELYYPISNGTLNDMGTVLTNADGKWSCMGPPELGRIEISLDHPDYIGSDFDLGRADTPPIDAMRDGSAVQHMKRGQRITGHVVGPDGKPLWNALVLAGQFYSTTGGEDEAIEDSTTARTERDGSFSIGGIPAGKRQLVVSADNMAPTFVPLLVSTQTPAVTVKMQTGHDMFGRVVDEESNPIVGAHVTIDGWTMTDAFTRPLPQKAMSDSEGHFKLSGLPSDGTLRLYAGKKGRLGTLFEVAAAAADVGDVTLCNNPRLAGRVVDDVTGKPVKVFHIKLGCVAEDGRINYSSLDASADCTDGTFGMREQAWIIDRSGRTQFCAKITAEGYAPQVTPFIMALRPSPAMTIRLKRAAAIMGTVVDAQGAPVAAAEVFWVSPTDDVGITGCKIDPDYSYAPDVRVTTDAAGRFSLPCSSEPGRILVLDEKGYALLASGDYRSGTALKLKAWARVEGRYLPGGRPAAAVQIQTISPPLFSDPTRHDHLGFQLKTITDAEGHFVIDHVPSLPLRVEAGASYGPAAFVNILAQPGQTLHVDLGRGGSPVTGQIDLTQVIAVNPPPEGTSFDTSTSWIRAVQIDPSPPPPAGSDPADWNSQLATVLNGAATENLPIPAYFADLEPDGSFSFVGLPRGKYELLAVIHAERPPNTCGWGLVLGRGHSQFTVADSPLELPPLTPDVIPHPTVGSLAPEFTGKDSTGKDFSLSSLRGKYVVLDFWAGWCGPCRAALPLLQDVYRKHASSDVAFVSLNYDYTPVAAASAVATAATPWPNIMLGPWDGNSPVLQAYDVSLLPSLWLIDPQGHIAARDPTLEQLDALLPKSP
jgi:thiol-disulfide isomerase/thioredoxin